MPSIGKMAIMNGWSLIPNRDCGAMELMGNSWRSRWSGSSPLEYGSFRLEGRGLFREFNVFMSLELQSLTTKGFRSKGSSPNHPLRLSV